MYNLETEKVAKDLIYIISCGLNKTIPEKTKLQAMNLNAVFNLASKHMLSAMVAITLESAGIKNDLTSGAIIKTVRRDFFFEKAWKEISSELEQNKIWYMPLKGAVLKGYYPKVIMREYSDYDILFDEKRSDDVKSIMEQCGFETKLFDDCDQDVYERKPVCVFEMHRSLSNAQHTDVFYDYYQTVDSKLIKDSDNEFGYHFSDEDFYIFFLVHEYKHFIGAGTGLRSLADTYVLNKHYGDKLDKVYLSKELRKLGIYEFERDNRILAEKLFTGKELDEKEKELFNRYLFSDAYGNFKTRITNQGVDSSIISKIRYALKRITLPESFLRDKYPLFYKYKISRPFLYVYRLIRKAIKSPQALKSEIRELKNFK